MSFVGRFFVVSPLLGVPLVGYAFVERVSFVVPPLVVPPLVVPPCFMPLLCKLILEGAAPDELS